MTRTGYACFSILTYSWIWVSKVVLNLQLRWLEVPTLAGNGFLGLQTGTFEAKPSPVSLQDLRDNEQQSMLSQALSYR